MVGLAMLTTGETLAVLPGHMCAAELLTLCCQELVQTSSVAIALTYSTSRFVCARLPNLGNQSNVSQLSRCIQGTMLVGTLRSSGAN